MRPNIYPYICTLWLTKEIKTRLKKHNKIYKRFKDNGFNDTDKSNVDKSKSEVNDMILVAKEKYLQNQGAELANPTTGSK